MFQKLKQYKDLRDTAKQAQSVLETITVQADGAKGKVGVVLNGNQEIIALDIDDSLLAPEHKKTIEEGVKEAMKEAMKKLQREMFTKMKSGDLDMPDLSSLS